MALVIGTNAYVDTAFVGAYLAERGAAAAWEAAEEPAREAAIIEATSYLDAAMAWKGMLADPAQLLGWPRVCAADREGRILAGIPVQVQNATAELANLALGGRLVPMQLATVGGSSSIKREKIGDVEVEYAAAENSAASYDYVRMLLFGLGKIRSGNSNQVKLTRA